MTDRLLFIDTETGGLDPLKHSLLSIGVVVWDKKSGELFSDEYYIYSDNYVVTKSATRINHFNLTEHNLHAVAPTIVVQKLFKIRDKYFDKDGLLPLAGHNVTFDIQFIKQLFFQCGRSYEKLFSHRAVDTYTVIKFLTDCQLIPNSISSSASAFKYFNITVEGRHTALGDARATMQLYSKALLLIENRMISNKN